MKSKLNPIEHRGQRVITTELLAQVYETEAKNIQMNFANQKQNFKEGIHYFVLRGEALKGFKDCPNNIGLVGKNAPSLYLWTERGANRHCKILDTPRAWEQFDNLEETYFAVKEGRQAVTGNTQLDPTKEILAEAKLNNSRARIASMWMKVASVVPVPGFKQICASYASRALAGAEVLPLPEVTERTYTAEEVGEILGGLTANRVGRLANQHGLKAPGYGLEVWDKSRHSNKQVPVWRYNDKAVVRLQEILSQMTE